MPTHLCGCDVICRACGVAGGAHGDGGVGERVYHDGAHARCRLAQQLTAGERERSPLGYKSRVHVTMIGDYYRLL